jgi:hypothetical protein
MRLIGLHGLYRGKVPAFDVDVLWGGKEREDLSWEKEEGTSPLPSLSVACVPGVEAVGSQGRHLNCGGRACCCLQGEGTAKLQAQLDALMEAQVCMAVLLLLLLWHTLSGSRSGRFHQVFACALVFLPASLYAVLTLAVCSLRIVPRGAHSCSRWTCKTPP